MKARALGLSVLVLLAMLAGAATPGQAAHTISSGAPRTPESGYWMLTRDGHVFPFGGAASLGESVSTTVPRVDLEPTPDGHGYWILGADGSLASFGDAVVVGRGTDAVLAAGETFTSMSLTPDGDGYWLFTTAGRVLPFGRAVHFGDLLGQQLNGPVLDSVATPSGHGYFMVASDGGIFTFGDAVFAGSMGGTPLNEPVVSLAPDPDRAGYWLVAGDGGIFSFDAPFHGSLGGTHLNQPVTRMVSGPGGYLMVATDGGIFSFGTATFHGSLGDNPPPSPVVAVGVVDTPEPDPPAPPDLPAAPETTINSGPEGPTSTTSPSFSFTASPEEGATFECSLDGAPFAPCDSPRNYADLLDGAHTFASRATAGGVTDPSPATRSFTVDVQGPVVEILSPQQDEHVGPTGTIVFQASDAVSFDCALDGIAVACDAGAYSYSLEAGPHTFVVAAFDALGNPGVVGVDFSVDDQ